MSKIIYCFFIGLLLHPLSTFAVPFTLDFEGIGDNARILNFYNGGTDSLGNSGTDYGVSFGINALGLIDRDAGGSGNFANEPTADTVMFFLSGSAILNYSPGFDMGFSFFYTTSRDASVTVWDGLNGSGNLLGEINLSANSVSNDCVGDPLGGPGDPLGQFCNFDIGNLAFTGTALSIDFSGTVNQVGFDNITFGSTTPRPVDVHGPGALILIVVSLLSLGLSRVKGYR